MKIHKISQIKSQKFIFFFSNWCMHIFYWFSLVQSHWTHTVFEFGLNLKLLTFCIFFFNFFFFLVRLQKFPIFPLVLVEIKWPMSEINQLKAIYFHKIWIILDIFDLGAVLFSTETLNLFRSVVNYQNIVKIGKKRRMVELSFNSLNGNFSFWEHWTIGYIAGVGV